MENLILPNISLNNDFFEKLNAHNEFLILAASCCPKLLSRCAYEDCEQFVQFVVNKQGNALKYASERLTNDVEILKIAARNELSEFGLEYASKRSVS